MLYVASCLYSGRNYLSDIAVLGSREDVRVQVVCCLLFLYEEDNFRSVFEERFTGNQHVCTKEVDRHATDLCSVLACGVYIQVECKNIKSVLCLRDRRMSFVVLSSPFNLTTKIPL